MSKNLKKCVVCGDEFVPPKGNYKTCSKECSEKNFNSKNAVWQKKWTRSDKNRERCLRYYYDKVESGPTFRLVQKMRSRLYSAVLGKVKKPKTLEILGCNIDELKMYLQQTAIDNGYLDFDINRYDSAKYHIDHIKPISSFNLLNEDELVECFNYKNLQILKASINLAKNNKENYVLQAV